MLMRLLGRLVEILDALRSSLMAIYYYLLWQLVLDFRLHSVLDYWISAWQEKNDGMKSKKEKPVESMVEWGQHAREKGGGHKDNICPHLPACTFSGQAGLPTPIYHQPPTTNIHQHLTTHNTLNHENNSTLNPQHFHFQLTIKCEDHHSYIFIIIPSFPPHITNKFIPTNLLWERFVCPHITALCLVSR